MRILANVDTFAPIGGVELSTLQVCEGLAARGHQVDVLYSEPGGLQDQWMSFVCRSQRVRGFTVEFAAPWKQAHVLPGSVRAALRFRPDVVYLNRAEQLLWGTIVSRLAGVPLVCHLRHHPFSARAVSLLKGSVARYIAVSDFIRGQWIDAGVAADRIEVVHNGVDPNVYRPASAQQRKLLRQDYDIETDARVFLHYGRLTADKGVRELLAAWTGAKLPADWRLILVGDADPDIRSLLAMQDRGDIRVFDRRDDISELLAIADVTVLPALWEEPFGRVVIESMSAGVPVIASRRGGIPEILDGPWSRFLFEPADVDELGSAIRGIGNWRTAEPDLGDRSQEYVARQFGLAATVDGVESVLLSVCDGASLNVT